jgi:hypothetical protein
MSTTLVEGEPRARREFEAHWDRAGAILESIGEAEVVEAGAIEVAFTNTLGLIREAGAICGEAVLELRPTQSAPLVLGRALRYVDAAPIATALRGATVSLLRTLILVEERLAPLAHSEFQDESRSAADRVFAQAWEVLAERSVPNGLVAADYSEPFEAVAGSVAELAPIVREAGDTERERTSWEETAHEAVHAALVPLLLLCAAAEAAGERAS